MLVQVQQHMANRLEVCADESPRDAGVGEDTNEQAMSAALRNVCVALHKATKDHDASGTLNLLDELSHVTEDSFSGERCADSVVAACGASSSVLEAKFGPKVSLKALQSMAGLLQLFIEHSESDDVPCQCPKRIDVVPMTLQVLHVLDSSADAALQAAGLEALHSIIGYLRDSQREWPLEDVCGPVGDSGAVESTVSALNSLISSDCQARGSSDSQAPSSMDELITKALDILHFLCAQHGQNLERLAAAGGMATLSAAAGASPQPAALLLLARLALVEKAGCKDVQLCTQQQLVFLAAKEHQLQCAALMSLQQLFGAGAKDAVKAVAEDVAQVLMSLLLQQSQGHASVAVQAYVLGLLAMVAPASLPATQQLSIGRMLPAVGKLCSQLSASPSLLVAAPSLLAPTAALPVKVESVQWEVVRDALLSVMQFLSAAGTAGVDSKDGEGYTLLHRVAGSGLARAVELALAPPGLPPPNPLARTSLGDNALQLALRSGAPECIALLEGATQAAAAAAHRAPGDAEGEATKERGMQPRNSLGSQEMLMASPFASQTLPGPLSSHTSGTLTLASSSLLAASGRTGSAAGEDAINMYARAVEARRAELEQHAAAAQRAQQAAAQSGLPLPTSQDRQPSEGKLSGDGSRPLPPPSPQPQEGGPMLSAFADVATAAAHQTAFSIPGLDLSHAVGAGSLPQSSLPAGIPLDAPLTQQQQQQQQQPPLHGSPHLSAFSAFAGAQGGLISDSPYGTPSPAPPLSLYPPSASPHLVIAGSNSAVLPYPGEAAMQLGRSISSQLQDALFLYPQEGPGSPQSTGSVHSALAVAAAAAQLQRAVSAASAHHAQLPLQQGGRSGSAASEILQLLPLGLPSSAAAAAGQENAAELGLARRTVGGLSGCTAGFPDTSCCDGRGKDADSDVSGEPTRHLWIGNLGTRTPRTVLKTIFDKFGTVDDVVTFPGRMYAFVNYRTLEESMAAYAAMQAQVVPELTGDRPLLLKYRPPKKAAAHLRALGLATEEGAAGGEGSPGPASLLDGVAGAAEGQGEVIDKDGNSLEPSPRIWLGNIAPTATSKSLHAVLSRFGVLNDAAVFPARIGPLGYAFVKFERLEDAIQAFDALNNTVVPPLSGSKQLKMRYKPPSEGPAGKDDPAESAKLLVPSRHLWLGNVTQKPTDEAVLEVFAAFGKVDSVRVFPVKAYAFVNYAEIACAIKAMTALEGVAVPGLTGVKPLVMRYQQEAVVAAATAAAATPKPAVVPLSPGQEGGGLSGGEAAPVTQLGGAAAGLLPEDVAQAVPNLSNMLNPNNAHFDPVLAERYKALSRREKDLLWAKDQLMVAHQLAAAQQAAAAGVPAADLHMMMRGMNRSHSWNISMLHSHLTQHPNQPASGLSPALTAAAALAALQQQQQEAQQAQRQRQLAAMQLLNNPGEGGQASGFSRQSSQSLGAVTPQHAQQALSMQGSRTLTPAPQHPPAAASASPAQLSAVLSNLAALQSMHSVQDAAGARGGHPHPEAGLHLSMQRAASMPHPGVHAHPPGAPFSGLDAGVLLDTYLGGGSGGGGQQQQQQQQVDVLAGYLPPPSPPQGALSGSLDLSDYLAKQSLGGGPPSSSPIQADSLAPAFASYGSGSQTPSLPRSAALSPAALAPLSGTASPGLTPAGSWPMQHIPQHLLCPLSRQVMLDPVVAADGVTYERKAISEWLAFRGTSPATSAPLPHKMLTPSMHTKAALMDFLQRSQMGGGG